MADSDTVVAYSFDEASGLTATDYGPSSNNGTLSGSVGRSDSGQFDRCVTFGGADADIITIPHHSSLNISPAITVSAWIYHTEEHAMWDTVAFKSSDGNDGYYLYAAGATDRTPEFYIGSTNIVANAPIPLNTWTHIAVTNDGTTLTFYIDGGAAGTSGGVSSITSNSSSLTLGANSVWTGEGFDGGRIDDLRIYDYVQTPAQIQADMAISVGDSGSAPVTVTAETANLGLNSTEPAVSHIPAAQTTTPETAALGLNSTEPVVSQVAAGITVTPDATATLNLNATQPVVSHVPAAQTTTPETGTFALSSTEPAVSHGPQAVSVTSETGSFGLNSTEPVVSHVPAAQTTTPETGTFALSSTQPTVTSLGAIVENVIWPGDPTPSQTDQEFSNEISVGTKFRSAVAGTVIGMRYHRGSSPEIHTPTMTAGLWRVSDQARLATESFVDADVDTATDTNGWGRILFTTPVAIDADTLYVITHYTWNSYDFEANYFSSTGVTNGPLTAVANTESSNGVYVYGAGDNYPSSDFNASWYSIDVIVETGSAGATVTAEDGSFGLNATEPVISHVPAAVSVTAETASFGLNATEPAVSHVAAGSSVTPETASFGLNAEEPIVSHIDNITLTAATTSFGMTADTVVMLRYEIDDLTFGMTATAPVVTNVAATAIIVTAETGNFGLSATEPAVSHVPAAVSVTSETANFGLNSTEPAVTIETAAFSIVDVDGNAVDPTVYDNQENVAINCINAGAVEGIVEYGEAGNRVVQTNVDWPAIASGASTITVPFIDSGSLPLGDYELRVLKPI